MNVAWDHVRRGFWAAKEYRTSEAAAELANALWPPRRLSVAQGDGILYGFEERIVRRAYEDLIAKREPEAIAALERVLFPDGIPPHEQVVRKLI